jgi:uncharacterized membrane protein
MYLIFLGILGLLALASLFDRSLAGLTLLGIVALLALLVRKLRHLTRHIDSLEIEVGRLAANANTANDAEQYASAATRQPVEPSAASAAPASGAAKPSPGNGNSQKLSADSRADDKPGPAAPSSSATVGESAGNKTDSPAVASSEPNIPASAAARSMPAAAVTHHRVTTAQPAVNTPPGARTPPPKLEPAKPNWFDRLLRKGTEAAWAWITGGNVFVRVGILILFMGMTFLIRYAIGQNMIPIELRLAIVGAVAIALLLWGWTQRQKKANFALVVQGGGVGLLYLTIFASFSLYRVLDSTPAFVMLGVIVILAAILAVRQDAKSLALFAAVGGFLAPILTSSGSNNYIGLFSYYTLLNLGIFAVAWFKSWRILNLTGFVFTFAISAVWGVLSYRPEFFSTTQPFLIIFFLLYAGISVLFALRRSIDFRDTIDSSLVFGTPLLAFGMQCELVGDFEYGIAISAFSLAAFYLCTSYLLWKIFSTRLALLCETFISLAVIFATLAIPFAIDGSLTGSVWAIEGAGILWVSVRQQQFYRRLFASLLMLAAGVIIAWEIGFANQTLFFEKSAFANSAFIGATLITISAALGSWLLSPAFVGKRAIESKIEYGLLAYSTLVLLAGFWVQIIEFEMFSAHGHLLALLAVVTGMIYLTCAERLHWKVAHWMSLGYFSLLLPAAFLSFTGQHRLGEHYGYLLWPAAFIALFYSLKKIRAVLQDRLAAVVHLVAAGLLAMLLFWEGIWQLLLGFSLLGVLFCMLGERYSWRELQRSSILFLPVLLLCFVAAIDIDGNLVALSSIGSNFYPPFQPGGLLWPLAFATYFYLLLKNPIIGGRFIIYFYFGGALLISIMLLWLGLWPLLLGATTLCWLAYYLAHRLQWPEMRQLSKLLFPLMVIVPIAGIASGMVDPVRLTTFNLDFQLAPRSGFFLWPLAFVTLYLGYWLSEKEKYPPSEATHGLSCLFLVAMVTWEISRLGQNLVPFSNTWHLVLLPIVGLYTIKSILQAEHWPFNRYREGFEIYALLPLAVGTIAWSLLQLTSSGRDNPLIWVPLLNPLDLMQCLILYGWFTHGREKLRSMFAVPLKYSSLCLAGFVFLWINVDILRFVHHWAGVSWDFSRLIQADLTQTLMSLVWSVIGLAGTFFAARLGQRQIWIFAAALLAVVVLKLFVIDLSAQDTIERIVSFTGVGVLLTFVGYFSPIPPRQGPVKQTPETEAA